MCAVQMALVTQSEMVKFTSLPAQMFVSLFVDFFVKLQRCVFQSILTYLLLVEFCRKILIVLE